MAEQANQPSYKKWAVTQTRSNQYGQCAFDIQDALNIGKVRLTIVNKREKNVTGVHVEHFMGFDDFLVVANDILNGSFKRVYLIPDKQDASKAPRNAYEERKGSHKKKTGLWEARILTIEYFADKNNPYHVTIAVGKGEKIGNGAVKMVGKAEKTCGIWMTEFVLKKLMIVSKLAIEQKMLADAISGKVSEWMHLDEEDKALDDEESATTSQKDSISAKVAEWMHNNDNEPKGTNEEPVATNQKHSASSVFSEFSDFM